MPWLLRRLLLVLPTLFGISLLTFAVMDFAPVDRAAGEVAQRQSTGELGDEVARQVALQQLRIRYGFVDAATGEPLSVLQRYGRWLVRAATGDLAGPGEDPAVFWARLATAFPITAMLGFWSLFFGLGLGIPLGCWLGRRIGSPVDRLGSTILFVACALPDFFVGTMLVLGFGAFGLGWFPTDGLRTRGAEQWGVLEQAADLASHLVLPVAVLALPIVVIVARLLREATARAARAPFAVNLRAWGLEPAEQRRRLLRAGLSPLVTMLGHLLTLLVGGTLVVEQLFGLPGVGRLTLQAVRSHDHAMVMVVTLLSALVTLLGLVVSDLLHRVVDPRVRL
jgi:peptide/nickel transport system permease protein